MDVKQNWDDAAKNTTSIIIDLAYIWSGTNGMHAIESDHRFSI